MASMLQRKRSFFSQDSCSVGSGSPNSSSDHLPMLVESRHCESPPPTITSNNPYAMDFGAINRTAPGRATSMSIVRQRSGNSLSPSTKNRPRKSISMFFSSTSSSGSHSSSPNSNGSVSDSSVDYSMPHYHQHSNPYGMLNPGPHSSRRRASLLLNSNSDDHNWIYTIFAVMGLITFAVLSVSTYEHNAHLNHELLIKEQQIEMHLDHSHELEKRVQRMRSESIYLHNRIDELEHPQKTEQELQIQRKVFHLEHYQEQLHRGIASQSKRLAMEK